MSETPLAPSFGQRQSACSPEGREWRSLLLIALFCAVVALGAACAFAPRQSLWVDETTQLGGLRQTLPQMMRFLRGLPSTFDTLNLPADRNPPLSFLLGKVWTIFFGTSENSLRYMGAALFAGAAFFTSLAGGLASPRRVQTESNRCAAAWAAWIAGLGMALSPTAVYYAVEIRAYPLLMLAASLSVLALVLCLRRSGIAPIIFLVAALTAAIYTHFFGVVLTGAILSGYFVALKAKRRSVMPSIAAGVAIAICSLGVVPFLLQALALSKGGPKELASQPASSLAIKIKELLEVWGHMTVHGASGIIPHMTAVAIACLTLLFIFGALAVINRKPKLEDESAALAPMRGVFTAIVAGFAMVTVGAFALHGFRATTTSYNLWLPPILFVAIGASVGGGAQRFRHVSRLLAIMLLATQLIATAFLATSGEIFAHAAHARIAATVRSLGPANVTVIHAGEADHAYAIPYYALRSDFGRGLTQYMLSDDHRLADPRLNARVALRPMSDITTPFVLLVITRQLRADDIMHAYRGADVAFDTTRSVDALEQASFHIVSEQTGLAYLSSRIIVLEKNAAP